MASNYCPNCGETALRENAKFCPNCGEPYYMEENQFENSRYRNSQTDYSRQPTISNPANQYNAQQNIKQKSPFLALILSFLWTGLGQLYNGKFAKGICFQIALAIGLCMLIIPGVIVWVICLWDAYNDSEKMNRGEIPFEEPSAGAIIAFIFFWVIVVFGLLFIMSIFFIPFALI
jgi:Rubrerythrin